MARVTNNVEDPDEVPLGRVQVKFPWLSDTIESGWERCTTPMAGSNIGLYFLPEVGDEVLVAFEQGNLSKPVIVGSLWNGKRRPPTRIWIGRTIFA